jgi:hypothetical protein
VYFGSKIRFPGINSSRRGFAQFGLAACLRSREFGALQHCPIIFERSAGAADAVVFLLPSTEQ